MLLELYNTDNLKLLQVGGAVTGDSNKLASRFFNSRQLSGKSRDVVVISTFLKEGLTPTEYQAIYFHEEGHHVLKHGSSNLDWRTKELQADSYACSKVGSKHLLSALQKIPAIISVCEPLYIEALKTKTAIEYFKSLDSFLNNIAHQMQFRYEALKTLS